MEENLSYQAELRKKYEAQLLSSYNPSLFHRLNKVTPEKNVLDIMSDIKVITGNKAGEKLFNKFLDKDRKSNFKNSRELLSRESDAYKFKLSMPESDGFRKPLNSAQKFALQELYLKHKLLRTEVQTMKLRKLDVAENNHKIINLAKNMTFDFRKAV